MKHEDVPLIMRAIGIGLGGLLVLALSCMLVPFIYHARRVEEEGLFYGQLHHSTPHPSIRHSRR